MIWVAPDSQERESVCVPFGDDEVYVDIQQGKIGEIRAQQMVQMVT